MHMWTCAYRSQKLQLSVFLSCFSTLFISQGFSLALGLTTQLDWIRSPRAPPVPHLPSTGIADTTVEHGASSVGTGDPNWSPHAYTSMNYTIWIHSFSGYARKGTFHFLSRVSEGQNRNLCVYYPGPKSPSAHNSGNHILVLLWFLRWALAIGLGWSLTCDPVSAIHVLRL